MWVYQVVSWLLGNHWLPLAPLAGEAIQILALLDKSEKKKYFTA